MNKEQRLFLKGPEFVNQFKKSGSFFVNRPDSFSLQSPEDRAEKEIMKERLIKTLGDLVAFETVTGDHGEMRKLLDYVTSRVHEVQDRTGREFIFKEYNNDGYVSMIIAPKDEKRDDDDALLRPRIAILIHADVVPPEGENPFELKIDGDKVMARGAKDMKGTLAVALELLDHMPAGVAIVITPDEEKGGKRGAGYLSKLGLRPDFMIVLDAQDERPVETLKGLWQLTVELNSLFGIGGHASRPGDYSAARFSDDFSSKLGEIYPATNTESPPGTTYNPGAKSGGTGANTVATKVTRELDFRFATEEGKEKMFQDVKDVLRYTIVKALDIFYPPESSESRPTINFIESGKDDDYKIEVQLVVEGKEPYTVATATTNAYGSIYHVDKENPQLTRIVEIMEKVTGRKQEFNPLNASTNDVRFFPDTPALVANLEGGGSHGADEWVSIDSMGNMWRVLKEFMSEELK